MRLDDTAGSYGTISVAVHWLVAAAVMALLGLGLVFEDMPRGADRMFYQTLHTSIGICVVMLFLLRAMWRLAKGFPASHEGAAWEQAAARVTHWLLILAVVVLAATGLLSPLAGGRAVEVFDWFAIPSPLPAMPTIQRGIETVHAATAKLVLLPLVVLHVAATLKHIVVDRDDLWRRMVPASPTSD